MHRCDSVPGLSPLDSRLATDSVPSRSAAAAVLVLAVSLYISSRTVADPDLWGHVRFGQDILACGHATAPDPYSYVTVNQPWINHEWLSEVIFAVVFNAFGAPGLLALKSSIMLAIGGLLYGHLLKHGGNIISAGAIILLVAYIMLVGDRTVRPQLFTYLLFLLLALILHAAQTRHLGSLWLVPPLLALWANLHGGFLAGLGLLLVWAAARIAALVFAALRTGQKTSGGLSQFGHQASLGRDENGTGYPLGACGSVTVVPWPMLQIALCLVLSLLATLLNPYGPRLIAFLLQTATVPRPDIVEWSPVDVTKTEGLAYLALVILSVYALATTRRPRSFALIAAFTCTVILPLEAFRHLPLFAIASAVFVGEHLCDAWQRWLGGEPGASHQPIGPRTVSASRSALFASLLPLTGALMFCGAAAHNSLRIHIDPHNCVYPARAVQLLKTSGVRGNLAVFFDWGEYAIWHLAPAVKVSYDGRRETVYSDELCKLNADWNLGLHDWDAILERYPTDLALIDRPSAGYNLMRLKAGWTMVYEDSLCALFARSQSRSLIDQLRRTPISDLPANGAGLCFP